MDHRSALQYCASHAHGTRAGHTRIVRLAEDFGVIDMPPPEDGAAIDPRWREVFDMLENAKAELGNPPTDHDPVGGRRYQRPEIPPHPDYMAPISEWAQWVQTIESVVRWSDDLREHSGLAWEWINQAQAKLPKAHNPGEPSPPPPVDPPPVRYDGFTAMRHHDGSFAIDWYPNGEDGPHKGHILRLPVPVTVTQLQFIGPLTTDTSVQAWQVTPLRIPDEWDERSGVLKVMGSREDQPCGWPAFADIEPSPDGLWLPYGTTLYTAVIRFDTPLALDTGQTCMLCWITHVRGDFLTGPRRAGADICVCWDSGIEFERVGIPADASHWHVGASSTNQIDPAGNGNIPAIAVIRALGFNPRIVSRIPGPSDYQSGRWRRGKLVA